MRTGPKIVSILALATALAAAGRADAIQITIPPSSGLAGQNVDVNIHTTPVTGFDIHSFQFELTYNANLITAIDVIESGTLVGFSPWGDATFNVTTNGSTGRIAVSHAGSSALVGPSGPLIIIRFLINPAQLTASSSALTFASFTFNEGTPNDTTSNGTLTINATPVISVSPNTGEVIRGQTLPFSVSGSVTNPVSWFTTNAGIATINGSGVLTGVAPGAVRVYAVDNAARRDTTDGDILIRGMGLTAGTASVVVGQSVSVPLTVTSLNGLGIRAGQVTLTFNGALLQATGVTTPAGTLLNGWGPVGFGASPGTCTVDFAGSSDLNGTGVLCNVTFSALAQGPSGLTVTSALFNETLPAKTTNGSVTVTALPSISVNPDNVTMFTGQTQQFTITGSPTLPITWSTLDASVAQISGTGLLTAMGGGVTKVHAVDAVGANDENNAVTVYDFTASLPTVQAPPGAKVRMALLTDRSVANLGIRSLQYKVLYNSTWITGGRTKPAGLTDVFWGNGGTFFSTSPGQLSVASAGSAPLGTGGSEIQVLELDLSPAVPVGTNIPINLSGLLCNEGHPLPLTANGVIQVRTSADAEGPASGALALGAPWPNPASGECRFGFTIPRGGAPATVAVYALDGRRVRTLYSGLAEAGVHDAAWDGRDASGAQAAAGLYFVRLEWNGEERGRKLARMR